MHFEALSKMSDRELSEIIESYGKSMKDFENRLRDLPFGSAEYLELESNQEETLQYLLTMIQESKNRNRILTNADQAVKM